MSHPRIRVEKVNMPKPFPSMWAVIYRHPVHGVLINPRHTHAEAIAYAERLQIKEQL